MLCARAARRESAISLHQVHRDISGLIRGILLQLIIVMSGLDFQEAGKTDGWGLEEESREGPGRYLRSRKERQTQEPP